METKIGSAYSEHEVAYMVSVLLDAGVLSEALVEKYREYYQALTVDFFSINNILEPASKDLIFIDRQEIDLLRINGNIIDCYKYIVSCLASKKIIQDIGINFIIDIYEITKFKLLVKHKYGEIALIFSEYSRFITCLCSALNAIFDMNSNDAVCVPLSIDDDDFFLFVDKINYSKIVNERILRINFISYPEIERWRQLKTGG